MLAPVLRLVLSVAAALPDSLAVRADVRLFAEAHYRALDRVLRDAAGVKGGSSSVYYGLGGTAGAHRNSA